MENKKKKEYVAPNIEIVEFELEDHIAASGDFVGGSIGTEDLFN